MGYAEHKVIQHGSGFRRTGRPAEQEGAMLFAMLVSLCAAKGMAENIMRSYPKYSVPCQAIIQFASDSQGEMSGAIARLEEIEETSIVPRFRGMQPPLGMGDGHQS